MVWGSNTGIKKTLVSAGLASSVLSPLSSISPKSSKFFYIKLVQTRFPTYSDSRFVYHKASEIFLRWRYPVRVFASKHALKASVSAAVEVLGAKMMEDSEDGLRDLCSYEERRMQVLVLHFTNSLYRLCGLRIPTKAHWWNIFVGHLDIVIFDGAKSRNDLRSSLVWMQRRKGETNARWIGRYRAVP
ncbi:hypothetical protein NE237_021093 [Protea cynaroides]|uniref:Uncharacterized protein n=1 Tax=Protea cynaroides TaxID=273540 RepID=A0A9Q0H7W2_9MAGN|nr:hypothetical protein NE237_021093 [Protea cynaroides]